MKLFELLRKGFSFLLMSMGVSSPESKKPRPKTGSDSNP
jgi:hypothetical protein